MKRTLFAFLFLTICCLLANCSGTSAPLEVTKAWSSDTIGYSPSPGMKSVLLAASGERFVMVEFVPKSEAELKFKPEDMVLIGSDGKKFVPTGIAPFADMNAFKDFESIKSGNVRVESPEGGKVAVGILEPNTPTGFSIAGKGAKAALVYDVPAGGSDFQLKIMNASPIKLTIQEK
jgi:hypothetical protein